MEVISPVQRLAALNRGMFFKDCFFLSGEPSVETPERNRWKATQDRQSGQVV
jgi:hypothetical protein